VVSLNLLECRSVNEETRRAFSEPGANSSNATREGQVETVPFRFEPS
jgi:hypothetical protein